MLYSGFNQGVLIVPLLVTPVLLDVPASRSLTKPDGPGRGSSQRCCPGEGLLEGADQNSFRKGQDLSFGRAYDTCILWTSRVLIQGYSLNVFENVSNMLPKRAQGSPL